MKIILTLEIKRSPKRQKKSSTPQKPTAQSNPLKNTVIINQK
jgi:hypothetical protein